jgi:hypothetical protein
MGRYIGYCKGTERSSFVVSKSYLNEKSILVSVKTAANT